MITVKSGKSWVTIPVEGDIEWEYIFNPSFAELERSERRRPQGVTISDVYATIAWSTDSGKYVVRLSPYPNRRVNVGTYATEALALKAAAAASWRYAQVIYKTAVWREISGRPEQIIPLKWPRRVPREKRSQSLHNLAVRLGGGQ